VPRRAHEYRTKLTVVHMSADRLAVRSRVHPPSKPQVARAQDFEHTRVQDSINSSGDHSRRMARTVGLTTQSRSSDPRYFAPRVTFGRPLITDRPATLCGWAGHRRPERRTFIPARRRRPRPGPVWRRTSDATQAQVTSPVRRLPSRRVRRVGSADGWHLMMRPMRCPQVSR
jgi:hypothetical protein